MHGAYYIPRYYINYITSKVVVLVMENAALPHYQNCYARLVNMNIINQRKIIILTSSYDYALRAESQTKLRCRPPIIIILLCIR